MSTISNATVLITGAASGLGRGMANLFAQKGARLVLWDLDQAGLGVVADALRKGGTEVLTQRCDLSDAAAIAAAAEETIREVGGVDILVNNAGIVSGKPLLEISDASIERTFAVNTLALFRTVKAFLPGMIERGHGHIVTIASAGGLIGTARLTDYCSSKFAAIGFDDSLRLELKRLGHPIKTTVVCPFYIDTGMFAGVRTRFPWLLPILKPDYVVNRIVRAVERGKSRLIMPRFVYVAFPTRLLPVGLFDGLMDFFGINRSMDDFHGRTHTP